MQIKRRGLVRSISLLILLVIFVAGCKKSALYHNLSEGDAHEIIVALYDAGIEADKEKEMVQNKVFWSVRVANKDLARARKILIERNIPRKKELGLSGVYEEKGLIPTPDEQKARFLLAMKGEIVNSLERIPEVIDADVVINIPTPEEFGSDKEKRPTASVVLKLKPDDRITSQITESKIQQFIANSVEDLNPRDVSVILSYVTNVRGERKSSDTTLVLPGSTKKKGDAVPSTNVRVAGINVSKKSAGRLKIYLSIFFVLLIIMSAVLIVNVVRTTRMKQEFKALAEGSDRPLLEGEIAENEEGAPPGPEDEGSG